MKIWVTSRMARQYGRAIRVARREGCKDPQLEGLMRLWWRFRYLYEYKHGHTKLVALLESLKARSEISNVRQRAGGMVTYTVTVPGQVADLAANGEL